MMGFIGLKIKKTECVRLKIERSKVPLHCTYRDHPAGTGCYALRAREGQYESIAALYTESIFPFLTDVNLKNILQRN